MLIEFHRFLPMYSQGSPYSTTAKVQTLWTFFCGWYFGVHLVTSGCALWLVPRFLAYLGTSLCFSYLLSVLGIENTENQESDLDDMPN